jgi:hypothetical protein
VAPPLSYRARNDDRSHNPHIPVENRVRTFGIGKARHAVAAVSPTAIGGMAAAVEESEPSALCLVWPTAAQV